MPLRLSTLWFQSVHNISWFMPSPFHPRGKQKVNTSSPCICVLKYILWKNSLIPADFSEKKASSTFSKTAKKDLAKEFRCAGPGFLVAWCHLPSISEKTLTCSMYTRWAIVISIRWCCGNSLYPRTHGRFSLQIALACWHQWPCSIEHGTVKGSTSISGSG